MIPGGLPQLNTAVSSNGKVFQNQPDNIQPRFGAAYSLNDKTAIHGAIGVFFDNWANFQQLNQNVAGTWPEVQLVLNTNMNYNVVNITAENPLPGGAWTTARYAVRQRGVVRGPKFQERKVNAMDLWYRAAAIFEYDDHSELRGGIKRAGSGCARSATRRSLPAQVPSLHAPAIPIFNRATTTTRRSAVVIIMPCRFVKSKPLEWVELFGGLHVVQVHRRRLL